jgi:hypothetical protein
MPFCLEVLMGSLEKMMHYYETDLIRQINLNALLGDS